MKTTVKNIVLKGIVFGTLVSTMANTDLANAKEQTDLRVKESSKKLNLENKKSTNFTNVEIGGSDYIQLRELIGVLNSNANSGVKVNFDSNKGEINVNTNVKAREALKKVVNTRVEKGSFLNALVLNTKHKLLINGRYYNVNGYLINGRNYFRLADLAKVLNIGYYKHPETKALLINTKENYITSQVKTDAQIRDEFVIHTTDEAAKRNPINLKSETSYEYVSFREWEDNYFRELADILIREEAKKESRKEEALARKETPVRKEESKKETRKEEPNKETRKEEPNKETRKEEPNKETRKEEPNKETKVIETITGYDEKPIDFEQYNDEKYFPEVTGKYEEGKKLTEIEEGDYKLNPAPNTEKEKFVAPEELDFPDVSVIKNTIKKEDKDLFKGLKNTYIQQLKNKGIYNKDLEEAINNNGNPYIIKKLFDDAVKDKEAKDQAELTKVKKQKEKEKREREKAQQRENERKKAIARVKEQAILELKEKGIETKTLEKLEDISAIQQEKIRLLEEHQLKLAQAEAKRQREISEAKNAAINKLHEAGITETEFVQVYEDIEKLNQEVDRRIAEHKEKVSRKEAEQQKQRRLEEAKREAREQLKRLNIDTSFLDKIQDEALVRTETEKKLAEKEEEFKQQQKREKEEALEQSKKLLKQEGIEDIDFLNDLPDANTIKQATLTRILEHKELKLQEARDEALRSLREAGILDTDFLNSIKEVEQIKSQTATKIREYKEEKARKIEEEKEEARQQAIQEGKRKLTEKGLNGDYLDTFKGDAEAIKREVEEKIQAKEEADKVEAERKQHEEESKEKETVKEEKTMDTITLAELKKEKIDYDRIIKFNNNDFTNDKQGLREYMKKSIFQFVPEIKFKATVKDFKEVALELNSKSVESNIRYARGSETRYSILDDSLSEDKQVGNFTYKPAYAETKEVAKKVEDKIDEFIKTKLSEKDDQVTKIKKIHDFIAEKSVYTEEDRINNQKDNFYEQLPSSIMLGKGGVCEAYAMLFSRIADRAGLESKVVVGYQINSDIKLQENRERVLKSHHEDILSEIYGDNTKGQINHAWNQVKVEDKWYHIDVTHDDPQRYILEGSVIRKDDSDPNFKTYENFLKSDEFMKAKRTWDERYTEKAPTNYEHNFKYTPSTDSSGTIVTHNEFDNPKEEATVFDTNVAESVSEEKPLEETISFNTNMDVLASENKELSENLTESLSSPTETIAKDENTDETQAEDTAEVQVSSEENNSSIDSVDVENN